MHGVILLLTRVVTQLPSPRQGRGSGRSGLPSSTLPQAAKLQAATSSRAPSCHKLPRFSPSVAAQLSTRRGRIFSFPATCLRSELEARFNFTCRAPTTSARHGPASPSPRRNAWSLHGIAKCLDFALRYFESTYRAHPPPGEMPGVCMELRSAWTLPCATSAQ